MEEETKVTHEEVVEKVSELLDVVKLASKNGFVSQSTTPHLTKQNTSRTSIRTNDTHQSFVDEVMTAYDLGSLEFTRAFCVAFCIENPDSFSRFVYEKKLENEVANLESIKNKSENFNIEPVTEDDSNTIDDSSKDETEDSSQQEVENTTNESNEQEYNDFVPDISEDDEDSMITDEEIEGEDDIDFSQF